MIGHLLPYDLDFLKKPSLFYFSPFEKTKEKRINILKFTGLMHSLSSLACKPCNLAKVFCYPLVRCRLQAPRGWIHTGLLAFLQNLTQPCHWLDVQANNTSILSKAFALKTEEIQPQ